MKALALRFVLVLLIASSNSALALQDTSTSDWQIINPDGLFTFRVPQGFVKRSLKGAEDKGAEYVNGRTKIEFVWGSTRSFSFNDRQRKWMNDYTERTTRIRGMRANIRTYWQRMKGGRIYRAELNVGNWQEGAVELYMAIEGPDPKTLELANAVFASVAFPIPTPERVP